MAIESCKMKTIGKPDEGKLQVRFDVAGYGNGMQLLYSVICSPRHSSTLHIYRCLSHWTKRKHHNKNYTWIAKKYFHKGGNYNWIFFGIKDKKDGSKEVVDLQKAGQIPIKRYTKIKAKATPYDPDYVKYFANRKQDRNNKLYHYWLISTLKLFSEEQWITP